jgi:hypothetical protein
MSGRSFRVAAASVRCAGQHKVEVNAVGYRIIYYVRRTHGAIWMLTMYPKNVAENIPTHVLRKIRKEVEDG